MLTEYPVRTLQTAFDTFLPGVAAGGEHVHLGPHFDVRGAQSPIAENTLFMLNGNSFTDRLFTGYQWGMYCPLIGDIDRMEVVLGPGSLMHGSGAMSGFVNVIQKNGADHQGVSASETYGYPDQLFQEELNYGNKFSDDSDLYAYGGVVQARGNKYKDDFGHWFDGSAGRPELPALVDQKVKAIKPSFRLSTNYRNNNFKFSGFVQDFTASTDSFCTNDTAAGTRRDTVVLLAPEYMYDFDDNNSLQIIPSYLAHDTVRTRFVYDSGINVAEADLNSPYHFEDAGAGSQMYRGQATFRTTAFTNQKLAVGLDASHSLFFLGSSLVDPYVDVDYEGLPGTWTESSAFFDDVYSFSKKFQASLGARYDQVNYGKFLMAGTAITPKDQAKPSGRVAASYLINDTNSVKFSIQQGFRYATPGELQWWVQSNILSKNAGYGSIPEIQAAQETSYEANYHNDLKDLKLSSDLNLYVNKFKNWIAWADGATQLTNQAQIDYLKANAHFNGYHWINVPSFTNIGAELMLKYAPFTGTLFGLGYAYSQPYDSATGKDVYGDYPTHQIKANIKLDLIKKLTFTAGVIVENSAPISLAYGSGGSTFYTESSLSDPRFILNFLLDYRFTENWSTSLSFYNVTENKHMAHAMDKGYLNRDQRYTYIEAKYKM